MLARITGNGVRKDHNQIGWAQPLQGKAHRKARNDSAFTPMISSSCMAPFGTKHKHGSHCNNKNCTCGCHRTKGIAWTAQL